MKTVVYGKGIQVFANGHLQGMNLPGRTGNEGQIGLASSFRGKERERKTDFRNQSKES